MNIAILGAGAWGTALAVALSARHSVALWARDPSQSDLLSARRRNTRYLAEIALPDAVKVSSNLAAVLSGSDALLIATPTAALRNTLLALKDSGATQPIVWACKGLDSTSGKFPHQIVAEVLGGRVVHGALSGPSFALEVAQGRPTALTLASGDEAFARQMARELHQPTLRVYFSSDLIGVEIGGAVKNVMAIATGVCDGLGLGLNARAALITRGLAELTRLGVALGGRTETFMGLTGAGDLILTCTGDLSRNRRVGMLLAQGQRLDAILSQIGHVAEGVYSGPAIAAIAAERDVDMPITQAVCAVLSGKINPGDAVRQLLSRDPKSES